MSGFIYLASPYWHSDEMVRLARELQAKVVTAELLSHGFIVYSPIVHNHALVHLLPERLQHNHEFWMSVDLPILAQSDALWILCLAGWEASRGIAREIAHAQSLNIPITYKPFGEVLANPSDRTNPDLTHAATADLRSAGSPGTR